jgi:UDP-N-acetylglucosamine 2-epimerase (non-hydrolysing)
MKIVHVVGARPNFAKVAPLMRALDARDVQHVLVHTGQHYDEAMSDSFLADLGMPPPAHHLAVGSGSHTAQTAKVMLSLEPVLKDEEPDLVVVVGDVNSTLGAALVCAKEDYDVAHVEAGLRSFDRSMPEEINRELTDRLAVLLFAPSRDAVENLRREGIPSDRVHLVGNLMIDSLQAILPKAKEVAPLAELGLKPSSYAVATIHRPANVDRPDTLAEVIQVLDGVQRSLPVVFPVHPRTAERIRAAGLQQRLERCSGLRTLPPLGYAEFIGLLRSARLVLTDSGGVQEEATVLGVPCLTLRERTERPVTVEVGTNTIVGTDVQKVLQEVGRVLGDQGRRGSVPEFWDGKASERAARVIKAWWHDRRTARASRGT